MSTVPALHICFQVEEEKVRVGMVFQNAALFDSLTVGENVGFLLYEVSSCCVTKCSFHFVTNFPFCDELSNSVLSWSWGHDFLGV